MNSFQNKYLDYVNLFNTELNKYINTIKDTAYENIYLAMQYSLLAGGKRIRPVLMLNLSEELGLEITKILPYCIAMECIHTYSLIHDDLPCMDNDDLRRGKPTNHKVFGEGNAVLAGDALLNFAYEILFKQCENGSKHIKAAKLLSKNAGIGGMISGQAADLYGESTDEADFEFLKYIHTNKTVKLIQSALLIPSILSDNKYYDKLNEVGDKLGLLFQYTDDILDVTGSTEKMGKTIGKDIKSNKLTILKIYGLEKSYEIIEKLSSDSIEILNELNSFTFLKELILNIKNRTH